MPIRNQPEPTRQIRIRERCSACGGKVPFCRTCAMSLGWIESWIDDKELFNEIWFDIEKRMHNLFDMPYRNDD